MSDRSEAYVAFDTSKLRNAVAIAEGGRSGEVRFLGVSGNSREMPVNSAFLKTQLGSR
jgi:hypothetical protein